MSCLVVSMVEDVMISCLGAWTRIEARPHVLDPSCARRLLNIPALSSIRMFLAEAGGSLLLRHESKLASRIIEHDVSFAVKL